MHKIKRRQHVVRKLPLGKSKVLDVGCGEHKIIRSAVGVDIYPYKDTDKISYAENLLFKDESFDSAVMLEVIEHLKNPEKAIKEIHRVLKKNGQIIISTPNVDIAWKNNLVCLDPYIWKKMEKFAHK